MHTTSLLNNNNNMYYNISSLGILLLRNFAVYMLAVQCGSVTFYCAALYTLGLIMIIIFDIAFAL